MAPRWNDGELELDGIRLHYTRTGRGDKPPLVLTHGFSDNGMCWAPVARGLESKYDVIMPDMRGHGLSSRAARDEAVDMAADLAGLVRGLGLERPILCGHSMGAMVSFQAAVRFPDLAGALVLEDPPWWSLAQTEALGRAAESPIVTWARSLAGATLEQLLVDYRRDHPDWPEETLRSMCESKKQLDQGILDTLNGRMLDTTWHWSKHFGDVACPALVLTADPRLGGIVTPEVAARLRELNPRASFVNIPGAGHLIRYDAFDSFMGALRAFLSGLPTRSADRNRP
jgi:pimeloyl-ACP methyl ester carboxylesterase